LSTPSPHLDRITLEELAEGSLPPARSAEAGAHIETCARCAGELEGYRALFELLGEIPRFAPSFDFTEAVMARVQIAPRTSRVAEWLWRRAPATRRGWALLGVMIVAPVTPILALAVLVLTQPLVSPSSLWQWGTMRAQSAGQSAMALALEQMPSTGFFGLAEILYATLQAVPSDALHAALVLLAIGIPLSGWGMVRLIRTPEGSVSHAN